MNSPASILKRTVNGLAFQMRSYGEYLAAEELENAPVERVKPNSRSSSRTRRMTAGSMPIELSGREFNPPVRAYFVPAGILSGRFPLLPQRFPTMKKRGSWRVH